LTYTAQPGFLENIEVYPENYKTRQAVSYEFSFETKNNVFADGNISIRVPPELSVDDTNLSATGFASIQQ
jgi:hypothetical protein